VNYSGTLPPHGFLAHLSENVKKRGVAQPLRKVAAVLPEDLSTKFQQQRRGNIKNPKDNGYEAFIF